MREQLCSIGRSAHGLEDPDKMSANDVEKLLTFRLSLL